MIGFQDQHLNVLRKEDMMFISKYTSQLKDKLRESDYMASANTKLLLDPTLNKTVIGNLESQL